MDRTVICTHPDQAFHQGGFLHCVDRAVELFTGNIPGDGRSGDDLLVRLERRQVGRDRFPRYALVGSPVQVL